MRIDEPNFRRVYPNKGAALKITREVFDAETETSSEKVFYTVNDVLVDMRVTTVVDCTLDEYYEYMKLPMGIGVVV